MVGETPGTTAPRRALPRGLHFAGGPPPPGATPSPSLVRPALSSGLPDLADARRRPTTAGGADRHHGHLAHLGAKLIVSSASALCRHRRWPESRWQPLGHRSARLFAACRLS